MDDVTQPASFEDLRRRLQTEPGAVVYFTSPTCNVCKVLEPKVRAMLEAEYPRLPLVEVDVTAVPEVSAQLGVFTIPTVLVFFDGRETARLVRTFGLGELREAVDRPYGLIFE